MAGQRDNTAGASSAPPTTSTTATAGPSTTAATTATTATTVTTATTATTAVATAAQIEATDRSLRLGIRGPRILINGPNGLELVSQHTITAGPPSGLTLLFRGGRIPQECCLGLRPLLQGSRSRTPSPPRDMPARPLTPSPIAQRAADEEAGQGAGPGAPFEERWGPYTNAGKGREMEGRANRRC